MLDDCVSYLDSRNDLRYEIIIVSDGSTDKTVEVATDYGKKLGMGKFRVLNLERNRGKGGAVRLVRFQLYVTSRFRRATYFTLKETV